MNTYTKKYKNKIIVILGQTATGKSDRAVRIAKKFDGEIISADSRQVYKGLDIGSGKITKEEMGGITHHLLDVASPKRSYTAARYKKHANKALQTIWARGNLPIVCGGTGFYIDVLLERVKLPSVPPDPLLRHALNLKSREKLISDLGTLNSQKVQTIDTFNRQRLIRAIEVETKKGKSLFSKSNFEETPGILFIGIPMDKDILRQRIHDRLVQRIKIGMVSEAEHLKQSGLSWKRFDALGLEYRYLALLLQKKINSEEFLEMLENKIWQYSKRQKTWFNKNKDIHWFTIEDEQKMFQHIEKFLEER